MSDVQPVLILSETKSAAMAAALGFFLGPLGLLYSTLFGAIVMLILNILVAAVTLGMGLVLTWPICAVWGFVAALSHNRAQRQKAQRLSQTLAAARPQG